MQLTTADTFGVAKVSAAVYLVTIILIPSAASGSCTILLRSKGCIAEP